MARRGPGVAEATPQDIAGLLAAVRAGGRDTLLEHEVYAVLAGAGFDVPRHAFWPGGPEAAAPSALASLLDGLAGRQVVLKIASTDILHKTEAGGVAAADATTEAVLASAARVWSEVARNAPAARRAGILVTERLTPILASPAAETLLSLKLDPAFGPVVVLGLGGVLTEWFGELSDGRSTAIVRPGRVRDSLRRAAERMPAIGLLFRPSRLHPQPPLDLDVTAERLEALGRVALEFEELEVNPLLLTPDGRWVAVDGKARLAAPRPPGRRPPIRKIASLLRPRSAAVVGASATALNPGRIILRNLKRSEGVRYGHLHAVHPKEQAVEGIPCVKRIADLPERVDLAVVAVPAEAARDAIRELCASGLAESIILIPGGFAEVGRSDLESDIRAALSASREREDEGPVLVGGNCLGIVSKGQYNTFFLPQYKLPFHDASGDDLVTVSQSGAYLVSLTSNLDGIVFPRASISFGNQMDLTVADFLEYFANDDSVKVLACYVEGFKPGDGERFVELARAIRARGRRVVAFKAGKTRLGAQAALSHTASLAGDYAVARELLEDAGVVVAQTLDMFEDYVKAFTLLFDRIPPGRRLAVLSNAGFECAAVLDKLYALEPAAFGPDTLRRLRECLPAIAHADNPVDATPMATTRQFVAAVAALLEDPGVDALLVSPIPATPALDNLPPDIVGTHSENIYAAGSLPQELLRLHRESGKPMVVSVDSGRLYDDFVTVLQRGGIPVYRKIDRASRALSALCTL
ncbi:MAG TPA: acetate--CoA ligase family protein [Vicinamibacteria bacterium]|nr:acetate--CoA ligase family protein [Vicinamibacteria bacterium]